MAPRAKTLSLREQGFRPSAFPKLELCIHFKARDGGEETPAAGRGHDLHELFALVLAGEMKPEEIEDPESRECIEWALSEIDARGIHVHYVEYELEIIDEQGEIITTGTADAWGVTKELWVIDAKSGDEYDYSAQFAGYAKSVMEEQKRDECVFLLLYFDLRKAIEFEITYVEVAERVYALHDRFVYRDEEEPQANQYCDWCANRGSCKVWLESSSKALTVAGQSPDLVYQIEQIKKDPQRLADFYVAYKRLVKLFTEEWHISDALFEHLKNGAKPEGVAIGHRKGDSYIDPEQALLQCHKVLGSMRFAQAITVSLKLKEIWEGFTNEPFPLKIEQGPDIYFPKIAQPRGRGKARALRNKRAKEAVLPQKGGSR
jgi:hypothetical protein